MASPDRPQQPDARRTAAAAAAAAGEDQQLEAATQGGPPALLPPTERFAARTAGMTASEIRALFAVASRPEVVSLAGGMPNLAALPLQSLAAEVADLVGTDGTAALQYGSAQGVPQLREQICDVMREEGIEGDPNDVVVTVGSQMALDLLTRIFVDPDDVVLAEGPSYVGALGSFAAYQARVVHVAMDEHGLVPDLLHEALESLARQGTTPKFLYTIPNFHNPAGATLAVQRRPQILELCRRYGVMVIEDNPYGLLGFSGEAYPALRSYDPDVIYLGSFSKTFASGLRVGWALVPPLVRDRLVLAAESATLCPPTFTQMMVSRYLSHHDWRSQVKTFSENYRERRDAMLTALETYLPEGCSWNVPDGGFFVWLTVPEGVDTKAMLPRAVTARVAYASGTGFYADGFGSRQLRLSFCFPTPERITEGVRRLAAVLEAELDVVRTFGTAARSELPRGPQTPSPDTT
ncbi:PLP-dependent aminotransferase family protein [Pseudonocardia nantongensis]|uniref:aminotransferase-like domain-containing protein n=1 Tax=Pseudonocardia nantongensis TaxID=1181885 RepID=UPI0039798DE2